MILSVLMVQETHLMGYFLCRKESYVLFVYIFSSHLFDYFIQSFVFGDYFMLGLNVFKII